jgi:hypothetical protein
MRVPARLYPTDVMSDQPIPQVIAPKQYHEAFRYGIGINPLQKDQLTLKIKALADWVKGELR